MSAVADEPIRYLRFLGNKNADLLIALMSELFPDVTKENPIRFDSEFLLMMGFALNLYTLECEGVCWHLQHGIPKSTDLILMACANYRKKDAHQRELYSRLINFFVNHFAWTAHEILNAEVYLDRLDVDVLIDSIADLLMPE